MLSYKRIYIFEEILYIISPKYCIFKSTKSGELKSFPILQTLERIGNKNPLYYWRSIGEHHIFARKCDVS